MLKAAGGAAALTILGGIPLACGKQGAAAGPLPKGKRKKILVIGAHPDDPETAAGGTICLLTDAGHEVVCVRPATRRLRNFLAAKSAGWPCAACS